VTPRRDARGGGRRDEARGRDVAGLRYRSDAAQDAPGLFPWPLTEPAVPVSSSGLRFSQVGSGQLDQLVASGPPSHPDAEPRHTRASAGAQRQLTIADERSSLGLVSGGNPIPEQLDAFGRPWRLVAAPWRHRPRVNPGQVATMPAEDAATTERAPKLRVLVSAASGTDWPGQRDRGSSPPYPTR